MEGHGIGISPGQDWIGGSDGISSMPGAGGGTSRITGPGCIDPTWDDVYPDIG